MPLNFNNQALKGNLFLEQLAEALGDKKDIDRAGRILRSVFNVLRNHLTLEENFQLLAQLPVALKGVYVNGWSPAKKPAGKMKNKHDFIMEMIAEDGRSSQKDFQRSSYGEKAVKAVFGTMQNYVSYGEFDDIRAIMPKEIKELITDSIDKKRKITQQ